MGGYPPPRRASPRVKRAWSRGGKWPEAAQARTRLCTGLSGAGRAFRPRSIPTGFAPLPSDRPPDPHARQRLLGGVEPAQFLPALDQASHGLPARGHFAARVGPARPPGELRVVMLHDHGFGSRGPSAKSRTRPITRPSKMATPSVPGALSGKVRRQVMLGSFICSALASRKALWVARSSGSPSQASGA